MGEKKTKKQTSVHLDCFINTACSWITSQVPLNQVWIIHLFPGNMNYSGQVQLDQRVISVHGDGFITFFLDCLTEFALLPSPPPE